MVARRKPSTRSKPDAIALLKADHRQVKSWFSAFQKSRDSARKQELARKICGALRIHTSIEEEIFYPAFLEAAHDRGMHHEAVVEHESAKKLIEEIEQSPATDEWFTPKMSVLSEMINQHIKEEEGPRGMFARARKVGLDRGAIAEQLQRRKGELEGGTSSS